MPNHQTRPVIFLRLPHDPNNGEETYLNLAAVKTITVPASDQHLPLRIEMQDGTRYELPDEFGKVVEMLHLLDQDSEAGMGAPGKR